MFELHSKLSAIQILLGLIYRPDKDCMPKKCANTDVTKLLKKQKELEKFNEVNS